MHSKADSPKQEEQEGWQALQFDWVVVKLPYDIWDSLEANSFFLFK